VEVKKSGEASHLSLQLGWHGRPYSERAMGATSVTLTGLFATCSRRQNNRPTSTHVFFVRSTASSRFFLFLFLSLRVFWRFQRGCGLVRPLPVEHLALLSGTLTSFLSGLLQAESRAIGRYRVWSLYKALTGRTYIMGVLPIIHSRALRYRTARSLRRAGEGWRML
jgi:hypothetical protein